MLSRVLKGSEAAQFQWDPNVSGNWERDSSFRELNSLSAELRSDQNSTSRGKPTRFLVPVFSLQRKGVAYVQS